VPARGSSAVGVSWHSSAITFPQRIGELTRLPRSERFSQIEKSPQLAEFGPLIILEREVQATSPAWRSVTVATVFLMSLPILDGVGAAPAVAGNVGVASAPSRRTRMASCLFNAARAWSCLTVGNSQEVGERLAFLR